MNQLMNIIQKAATYEYHQAYRELSKAYSALNTYMMTNIPNVREFDKPTDIKSIFDTCMTFVDKTTSAANAALDYIAAITSLCVSSTRPILFLVDKIDPNILSEGSYLVQEDVFGVNDMTNSININDLAVNLIEDSRLCKMVGKHINCKIIPAKHRDDIKLYFGDQLLFIDYPYAKFYRVTNDENEERMKKLDPIKTEHPTYDDLMLALNYAWWFHNEISKIGPNPNNLTEITIIPDGLSVAYIVDKYEETINKTTYDFDRILEEYRHYSESDDMPDGHEGSVDPEKLEELVKKLFKNKSIMDDDYDEDDDDYDDEDDDDEYDEEDDDE